MRRRAQSTRVADPSWKAEWEAKRARQAKLQPEYRLALDIYSGWQAQPVPGPHVPELPSHGASSTMKWSCGAPDCDYWTGYERKNKASRMILQHCAAKNAPTEEPSS